MGTHPIFESDFDCLTDVFKKMRVLAWQNSEHGMMYQVKEGPRTSWVKGSDVGDKKYFVQYWRNYFAKGENTIQNVEIEKSGFILIKCEDESEIRMKKDEMSKEHVQEFISKIRPQAEFSFEGIFIRITDTAKRLNSLVQIQWLISLSAETQRFFQVLVMSEKFQKTIREKINRRESSPVKIDKDVRKKKEKINESDIILIDDSPTKPVSKTQGAKKSPKTPTTKQNPVKNSPKPEDLQAKKKMKSIRSKILSNLHKTNFVICGLISQTKDEIACGVIASLTDGSRTVIPLKIRNENLSNLHPKNRAIVKYLKAEYDSKPIFCNELLSRFGIKPFL